MSKGKPVMCTLTDAERAVRGAGWKDALRHANASITEAPHGVRITLERTGAGFESIEALVRAERKCCAWMTFDLHFDGAIAMLAITSGSAEGAAVIREMTRIGA